MKAVTWVERVIIMLSSISQVQEDRGTAHLISMLSLKILLS